MDIATLITPDSIRCDIQARSKKHALDLLSELLAKSAEFLTASEIFDSLIQRERLGCTALGGAVAIPHGRITGIDSSLGAFLRLSEPVDFDAADGEPVDLIFGLLIPEHCGEPELGMLKELATSLSDPGFQLTLREARDVEQVYAVIAESSSLQTTVQPIVEVR
jgi:PTS system nitrogen regulatory IIA component